MSWIKLAYPNVAFYNFEHPDGAGVMITSDSSTPQVYLVAEKIIEALGSKDFTILDSDTKILKMCKRLWGDPKVAFPESTKKEPVLKHTMKRSEIEEILELHCNPEEVIRNNGVKLYKISGYLVRLGRYGLQVKSKYIPLSSKDKIKRALLELLRRPN